jgi:hypothetical protein
VNPLYQLARGGADTYMAAEQENYRAAGVAGVKTVVLGAAAVVGIAQGAGALTTQGGASGATSAGISKAVTAGEAGAYGTLRARAVAGDKLTPHHMPQAALRFTSRAEGGALVLEHAEHIQTRTYGPAGIATARGEAGLHFRDVLARDIRDVRRIAGTKYDNGIRDLIQYYRINFPDRLRR